MIIYVTENFLVLQNSIPKITEFGEKTALEGIPLKTYGLQNTIKIITDNLQS